LQHFSKFDFGILIDEKKRFLILVCGLLCHFWRRTSYKNFIFSILKRDGKYVHVGNSERAGKFGFAMEVNR
jgi:hypothetical protein